MLARQDYLSGGLQVQAQMQAMQEQMQRPEVQEQMKEAQALMQDKGFAEKVEKLKVSWLALRHLLASLHAWHTSSACTVIGASCLLESSDLRMSYICRPTCELQTASMRSPLSHLKLLRKFHFPCCYLLIGRSRASTFL